MPKFLWKPASIFPTWPSSLRTPWSFALKFANTFARSAPPVLDNASKPCPSEITPDLVACLTKFSTAPVNAAISVPPLSSRSFGDPISSMSVSLIRLCKLERVPPKDFLASSSLTLLVDNSALAALFSSCFPCRIILSFIFTADSWILFSKSGICV